MTLVTTTPTTIPEETVAPEITTIPDVWTEEPTGIEWCECGKCGPLDREWIEIFTEDIYGDLPDRMTHEGVIAVTAELWGYYSVCEFFIGRVADAAVDVNGKVAEDYPLETGLAIIKHFSNGWHGCPMQGRCQGGIEPTL